MTSGISKPELSRAPKQSQRSSRATPGRCPWVRMTPTSHWVLLCYPDTLLSPGKGASVPLASPGAAAAGAALPEAVATQLRQHLPRWPGDALMNSSDLCRRCSCSCCRPRRDQERSSFPNPPRQVLPGLWRNGIAWNIPSDPQRRD